MPCTIQIHTAEDARTGCDANSGNRWNGLCRNLTTMAMITTISLQEKTGSFGPRRKEPRLCAASPPTPCPQACMGLRPQFAGVQCCPQRKLNFNGKNHQSPYGCTSFRRYVFLLPSTSRENQPLVDDDCPDRGKEKKPLQVQPS